MHAMPPASQMFQPQAHEAYSTQMSLRHFVSTCPGRAGSRLTFLMTMYDHTLF